MWEYLILLLWTHLFRKWAGASLVVDSKYYHKQCGLLISWTVRNKFQLNWNQNTNLFDYGNAFENSYKLSAIHMRPRDMIQQLWFHIVPAWMINYIHWRFGMEVISSHTLLGMWLIIHAGIRVNVSRVGHCSVRLALNLSKHIKDLDTMGDILRRKLQLHFLERKVSYIQINSNITKCCPLGSNW